MKVSISLILVFLISACAIHQNKNTLIGKWASVEIIGDDRLASKNFKMEIEVLCNNQVEITASMLQDGNVKTQSTTSVIEGEYLISSSKNEKAKLSLNGAVLELYDEKRNKTVLFKRIEY